MLTHTQQVCHSYRLLLKTIRHVFRNDISMRIAGTDEARNTFERFRHEQDPEQIQYLLSEANVAVDFLYREIIPVQYNQNNGKHFAQVEERHLRNDDGTPVHERKV